MDQLNRRAAAKVLLRIPVIGVAANWLLFGADPAASKKGTSNPDSDGTRRVPVDVVRLVNTAQHAYHKKFGRFVSMEELWMAEPVANILDTDRARTKGLDRAFLERLRFDQVEVAPGLQFQFALSADKQKYVVVVSGVSGTDVGAFSSDQTAAIHEGSATKRLS